MERRITPWHIIAVAAWRVVVATGLLAGVTLGGVPIERAGECLADALAQVGLSSRSSVHPAPVCPSLPSRLARSPQG